MLRGLQAPLLLAVCVSLSASTSVPEPCQSVFCPEDQICSAVPLEGCENNDCLRSEGRCVPISTKDGVCPSNIDGAAFEACQSLSGSVSLCFTDDDCPGNGKCCFGCCQAPEFADRSSVVEKPGACPTESIPNAFRSLWVPLYCRHQAVIDNCLQDIECPWEYKCCESLCGMRCSLPRSISAGQRGNPTETPTTTSTEAPTSEQPETIRPVRPVIEPARKTKTFNRFLTPVRQ